MAQHIWTVICSESSIDTETNRLSLFGVLEEISLGEMPEEWPVNLPISFEVVTLWGRSYQDIPEQAHARLVIEGPTKTEPIGPYEINLTETFTRFRYRARLLGLSITGLGARWFVVQLQINEEWIEVARVPLPVTHRPIAGN